MAESNAGPGLEIRFAAQEDVPLILSLIKELAEYERLSADVVADEASLKKYLFGGRRYAETLLAFFEGKPAGFALFFHHFSTFLCRPGIYLEDLFVRPEFRGKGIGKALLNYLGRLAVERKCGRLEWAVLNWNEPAIGFYKNLGARVMDDWTVFRLTGEALHRLAEKSET